MKRDLSRSHPISPFRTPVRPCCEFLSRGSLQDAYRVLNVQRLSVQRFTDLVLESDMSRNLVVVFGSCLLCVCVIAALYTAAGIVVSHWWGDAAGEATNKAIWFAAFGTGLGHAISICGTVLFRPQRGSVSPILMGITLRFLPGMICLAIVMQDQALAAARGGEFVVSFYLYGLVIVSGLSTLFVDRRPVRSEAPQ